jgi:hypothetical protein
MIVYKDYEEFVILGENVLVYSTKTDYGLSTVIEFGDHFYYYLGNESPCMDAILFAWQDHYNRQLSDLEIISILEENSLTQISKKLGALHGNQESNQEACQETGKEIYQEASKESCGKETS